MIGNRTTPNYNQESKHVELLKLKLKQYYPSTHQVVLYEASMYPGIEPKINEFLLDELEHQVIETLSTLYIPPLPQRKPNLEILSKFSI